MNTSLISKLKKRLTTWRRGGQLTENQQKLVNVDCQIQDGVVNYTVTDQGNGFNYREYLEVSTSRNLNMSGRGIAIARILSFDKLLFNNPGNQVIAQIKAGTSG